MEEPSVLDYVKSKLAFWKQSSIEIPSPEVEEADDQPEAEQEFIPVPDDLLASDVEIRNGTVVAESLSETRPAVVRSVRRRASFPWLPMLSLVFALFAQLLLDPQLLQSLTGSAERMVGQAMVMYLIAAVFMVVGFWKNDIQTEIPTAANLAEDDFRFRKEGLAVGLALMVLAFVTFGADAGRPHNFNFLNTALWLLSIGYLLWAFVLPGRGPSPVERVKRFLAQPTLKLNIDRWVLVLLVAVGLVLFFRFYRLDTLPSDMVSDHAEKLLDVQDVLDGQFHVFFTRNTGREFFQFYWTALMVNVFGTGISFMALKLGTVLAGLITLFYMYRLGKEIGNRWIALFVLVFAGVSYWANVQSRIGLRFPLYPMFAAPLLFYLIRGLRTVNRNDFIKAGLWLGLGLHGYTSFRIVPFLVVAAFLIFIIHERSPEVRKRVFFGIVLLAFIAFVVFLPLFRYALDDWDMFMYRAGTRMGSVERPLPGPAHEIFFSNLWNALTMFFWNDGDVWVHSVTGRPAMDVVAAAILFLGLVLVISRYLRRRHWVDLLLLVSIPMLLMPSVLSLAFPNENPNLNRTAAAYIPAFLILAIGLDALIKGIRRHLPGRLGRTAAWVVILALFAGSAWQSYDLLFTHYDRSFRGSAWNTSEMGDVVRDFVGLGGHGDDAYVVAFPYWVDTRLVGMEAGFPRRDMAITPDTLQETANSPLAKLFLLNREDTNGLQTLLDLYPEGRYWLYRSETAGKDFLIFLVQPEDNLIQMQAGPVR